MGGHAELEGELPVLALPDLEERPVVRGPDVVPLGVDEQDVGRPAAPDLPAEQEGRRAVRPDLGQRVAVAGGHLAAQPADVERRLEQVVDRGQALAGPGVGQVLVDAVEHLLGGGQVARRLQHEDPVGVGLEEVHLAVRADVVDPGVGAGVAQEDESLVEADGQAVGHGGLLGWSVAPAARSLRAPRDPPAGRTGGVAAWQPGRRCSTCSSSPSSSGSTCSRRSGRPTWTILVFARLTWHLQPVAIVLIGAVAAMSGRYVLATAGPAVPRPPGRPSASPTWQAANDLLFARKGRAWAVLAVFVVSPLPSAQLFVAAGLLDIALVPLTLAFFVGRLVSYSFYVTLATLADRQFGSVLGNLLGSPWSIAVQVLLLAGAAALPFVNWGRLAARTRRTPPPET